MSAPLVSVVIPVYNGRRFVADAIDSVAAQTHPAVECIVVDDGSTDGTADVVAATGASLICIQQPNRGVSAARNAGAERARGELLAFLDADDLWLPEKLAVQVAELHRGEHPMVMCAAEVVDAHLRPTGSATMSLPASQPLLGMVLFGTASTVSCSSTALVTREAYERLGGFDPELGMSADWDFLARFLLAFGGVSYVPQPLIKYRRHDANMSRGLERMESDMVRAYRKLFARPDLPAAVAQRKREAYASMRLMLAGSYWQAGQRAAALRNGALGVAWRPRRVAARLLRHARA